MSNKYLTKRLSDGRYRYLCFTCEKWVSHKKLHQEIHDGIYYQCPYCPQTYSRGSSLRDHIKKHLGLLFKCECGEGFVSRYLLRKHKRDIIHLLDD